MLLKLAKWLENRGSCATTYCVNAATGEKQAYLKKFYLFHTKWLSVAIHQIWSSGPELLHNHPWSSFTWVLRGGYHEHSISGYSEWRNRGYTCYRNVSVFHRLTVGPFSAGEPWMLFIHGPRKAPQGYLSPNGVWVDAAEDAGYKVIGALFPKVMTVEELANGADDA
jgi:hypothetical protein